jgi:hypothetical protein
MMLASTLAVGCAVETYPPAQPTPVTPTPTTTTPAPALDAPRPLGALGMLGYHVAANASVEMPAGDLGFLITANGQGGYLVTWTDTVGSPAHFSGTITTDGQFDPNQLTRYSGYENATLSSDLKTITFDSTPGTVVDGISMVPSTDPIYLDAYVDGVHTGFDILFTGADSGARLDSAYDPVAFTSP